MGWPRDPTSSMDANSSIPSNFFLIIQPSTSPTSNRKNNEIFMYRKMWRRVLWNYRCVYVKELQNQKNEEPGIFLLRRGLSDLSISTNKDSAMMSQFYITQEPYQEIWYTSVASLILLALILYYAYCYLRFQPRPKPLPVQTDQDAPIYKLPSYSSSSHLFVLSAIGSQVFKLEKPYLLYCLKALKPQLPKYLICHVCDFLSPLLSS